MTHDPRTGDAPDNQDHSATTPSAVLDVVQTLYTINQHLTKAENIHAILMVLQGTLAMDAATLLHITSDRISRAVLLQEGLAGDESITARKLDIPYEHITALPQTVTFVDVSDKAADDISALAVKHGGHSHIVIPLADQGRVADILVVVYKTQRAFDPPTRQLYEMFANQASMTMQNRRLLRESQTGGIDYERQFHVLETLNLLANSVGVDTDEAGAMLATMKTLVEATGADHAGTVLIEPDGKSAFVRSEYPDQGAIGVPIAVESNPLIDLLRQEMGRPILIEDIEHDQLISPEVLEPLRALGAKSVIIAPLTVGGELIGSVGLDLYTLERKFTPDMVEMVDALTSQLAIYVQDVRQRRVEALRFEQTEMIDHVINRFRTLNLVDSLLLEAARGLQEMMNAKRVAIRLGDTPMTPVDQEVSQA
ncbi:MAG: GAF domain-containing protein [Anaerolineae bacterium]|nr:GAF domain-containing protein [Anaerolineae bacterium]